MTRLLRPVLLVAVAVAAAPASLAADAIRLRPTAPVYVDEKGNALKQPEGVDCDPHGRLVVADTGSGRMVLYRIAGDAVSTEGELAFPELPSPIRVAIGPKGELAVLDGKLRRIGRVSPEGKFEGYLDPDAAGVKGNVTPRSLRVDGDGNLFVLDVEGARVLVLGADGKFSREIAFPAEYGFFSDLTVDDKGSVFVVDSVERRVFVARKGAPELAPLTGSLGDEMDFPTGIVSDGLGHLLVADQNGGGIAVLALDGSFRGRQSSMGWKAGFLRYPSGLCVDRKGNLFVADRANNRVQGFVIIP